MQKENLTKSAKETQKLGKQLAEEVLKIKNLATAVVIGLEGNLGAGKTTFAQGFAQGLRIKGKITSPTFVVQKRFDIKNSSFNNFYHIDCYRLSKSKEILDLGFKEIISDPHNIIIIEWPKLIKNNFPKNHIRIKIDSSGDNKREILYYAKM